MLLVKRVVEGRCYLRGGVLPKLCLEPRMVGTTLDAWENYLFWNSSHRPSPCV
jgi:hypothetical protein